MDALEGYFQEKLAVLELSRDVIRGNPAETQVVLLDVHKELMALKAELEEKRREVANLRHQLQTAAQCMALLQSHSVRVRDAMANIPPLAAAAGKQQPQQASASVDTASCREHSGQAKQEGAAAAPRVVVTANVAYLTLQEFATVPAYMKGRAQYESLNVAIDELNTAIQEKYSFLAKPFSAYSGLADKKRYKVLRSQETKDTKGVYFITAEELKNCTNLKSEPNRRTVFTILRHCRRTREIRGPGGLVRFAVI